MLFFKAVRSLASSTLGGILGTYKLTNLLSDRWQQEQEQEQGQEKGQEQEQEDYYDKEKDDDIIIMVIMIMMDFMTIQIIPGSR